MDEGKNTDYTDDPSFEYLVNAIENEFGKYPSIKLLEDVINHYKLKRHALVTQLIPELMQQMGVKKVTTVDGVPVDIRKEVNVKIEGKDKIKLIQWLIDEGYGDYIKDTLKFGKGELDDEIESYLKSKGKSYEKDSGIHPMSLKKIISDRIEDEEQLPSEDMAEILTFSIAKIKS